MGLSARLRLLALVWGFGEATLFFVVPDVLVTRIALRDRRRALEAAVLCAAGAMGGGALMWWWGARDPQAIRVALDALPAIGVAMMDTAARDLDSRGSVAALAGAFSGVPYKVFAAHAAGAGIGLAGFVLASFPMRLLRFALLALLAAGLGGWIARRWSPRAALSAWVLAWTLQYALYWSLMPG